MAHSDSPIKPRPAPRADASQRAVLDLREGEHAAVRGAPGSGKTHTVVELVAERINERGYEPEDLVVLAPDRRSATALRDVLSLRIDRPTRGPLARTLGSLAFQLCVARAVQAGETAPRLLTGADQDAILADLLAGELEDATTEDYWPDTVGPEVRALPGFRTELRELMMRAVETGTRPRRLAELGERESRPEWIAAAHFIERYERVMDQFSQPRLDSAEVIAEATALLSSREAEAPRLLIIDDFQEQGTATLEFLRACVSRGSTVIAFGDPDVASATFRGSDPGALSALARHLDVPVENIVLETVYRHGPRLRAVVSELSARVGAAGAVDHRRAPAALAAFPERPEAVPPEASEEPAEWLIPETLPVLRIAGTSAAGEQQAIARVLRERHIYHGIPWSDMAVIVRSSASIPVLARALALADVPTGSESAGESLRERAASRSLLLAAAVAIEQIPATAALYTDLLLGPLGGFDGIGLRRLRRALRHEELLGGGNRGSDELLLEALAAPDRLVTLDTPGARRAERFARSLALVREGFAAGATAEELLWTLWERSGLEKTWVEQSSGSGLVAEEAHRHLDAVMALFTAAKRAAERDPDSSAQLFIEAVLDTELAEDSLAARSRSDSVWIGTPSAVVGREFDVVVVARMQSGAWPNMQLRGALLYPQLFSQIIAGLPVADIDARAELLSDELRLFVLACSRARTQLVISAAESDDEQPSPFLRFPLIDGAPLRQNGGEYPLSLRGMVGSLRRRLVHASAAEDPAAVHSLARLARAGITGADPSQWYGLIEPTTTEPLIDLSEAEARVRVSPSRMETFENSPLHWFIEDIAAGASSVAAGIGTVVHSAFEAVGKIPAAELTPEAFAVERLWDLVDERWSELRFEAPWLGERERAGATEMLQGLQAYLERALRTGTVVLSAEGRFRLDVGQIRISGSIDRIERRADGTIVILDLKTGRSVPSQKSMETHAQLSAYQLALTEGAVATEREVAPGEEREWEAITGEPGGAALLFVRTGSAKPFVEREQPPRSPEELAAFRERVTRVGEGMAAATFIGVFGDGEFDPLTRFEYRIHLIAAVSE